MSSLRSNPALRHALLALVLALFAALQCFGIVHNAAHGFHKHFHHGQECPVYEFCDHQSLSTPLPTLPVIFAPFQPYAPLILLKAARTGIESTASASARAPPSLV